jgi:hypothetical protein
MVLGATQVEFENIFYCGLNLPHSTAETKCGFFPPRHHTRITLLSHKLALANKLCNFTCSNFCCLLCSSDIYQENFQVNYEPEHRELDEQHKQIVKKPIRLRWSSNSPSVLPQWNECFENSLK